MVTIRVHAPPPGAVLNPGDALTVAGVATGSPGTEPVSIETVTVALAGPPIEAVLTFVPHQPAPTVRFEATLTVPAVAGDQQLQAVAFADDLKRANVWVPVIIQAPQPPPPWVTSPLAPAGALPGPARLTAIAKSAGCELWWLGADGAVNGRWTEPGPEWVSNQLEWASYQLAGAGGAAPGGGITAVSKGSDLMEVWWIGPDGSVQAAYHDSDWHLYTLAGPGSAAVTGGIAGIFKGGDVMEVWWIGPDGSVQAAYHEGGWQAYTLAGSGPPPPRARSPRCSRAAIRWRCGGSGRTGRCRRPTTRVVGRPTRWPDPVPPPPRARSPRCSRAAIRWRCGGSGRTGRSPAPITRLTGRPTRCRAPAARPGPAGSPRRLAVRWWPT